jgi:DNA-binding transcriptional LysR family regulator
MNKEMNLRQLEMFRAVAEQGTFTRAAGRLHVSQSAVSRQVQLLEEEVGGALLRRNAKGVTVTEAGELLLRMAHRVERDVEEALAEISQTHALQRGILHLGGGMTVCLYILPRLLKKYRRLFPGVDLQITTGSSDKILEMVRSHEIDLGLLTLPINAKDLEVLPVMKEEMVVVTSPGHPLSREKTIDPKALGKFPLILYEPGSNTRKALDQFFLEEGITAEVAMETENVEIIKAMVAINVGITIVPYTPVARDVRSGRLAAVRIRGRRLFRETGWVFLSTDRRRAVTELLRVFDGMKDQFRTRPAGA